MKEEDLLKNLTEIRKSLESLQGGMNIIISNMFEVEEVDDSGKLSKELSIPKEEEEEEEPEPIEPLRYLGYLG